HLRDATILPPASHFAEGRRRRKALSPPKQLDDGESNPRKQAAWRRLGLPRHGRTDACGTHPETAAGERRNTPCNALALWREGPSCDCLVPPFPNPPQPVSFGVPSPAPFRPGN